MKWFCPDGCAPKLGILHDWPCPLCCGFRLRPKSSDLVEQGRRLASEREDLIAAGVDPAVLKVPLHPDDSDLSPGAGRPAGPRL